MNWSAVNYQLNFLRVDCKKFRWTQLGRMQLPSAPLGSIILKYMIAQENNQTFPINYKCASEMRY